MNAERDSALTRLRKQFHERLVHESLWIDQAGNPTISDSSNELSRLIGADLVERLGGDKAQDRRTGQGAGRDFERACTDFVRAALERLAHVRPGTWKVDSLANPRGVGIAAYQQYAHLTSLKAATERDPALAAALGSDYFVAPDIVVSREPEPDTRINGGDLLVDGHSGTLSGLRVGAGRLPILHAVISCKWTIRSDRAQNARTEALNLIRNRKGRVPHICVITAEPLPSRISSIALGTGDIDCTYHIALPELVEAVKAAAGNGDAMAKLSVMIDGERLRDIADLPLDIAT